MGAETWTRLCWHLLIGCDNVYWNCTSRRLCTWQHIACAVAFRGLSREEAGVVPLLADNIRQGDCKFLAPLDLCHSSEYLRDFHLLDLPHHSSHCQHACIPGKVQHASAHAGTCHLHIIDLCNIP